MFDARCTRFLGVDYNELAIRTLQGGSDEEILEWCFQRGRKPSEEEIEIWNAFLLKRGWRDAGSADLAAAKKRSGWAGRDDIQTWVDLHDRRRDANHARDCSANLYDSLSSRFADREVDVDLTPIAETTRGIDDNDVEFLEYRH